MAPSGFESQGKELLLSTRRRVSFGAIATAVFVLALIAATAQAAKLTYVRGDTTTLNKDSAGTASATCPEASGVHLWGGGQYMLSGLFGGYAYSSTPVDGKD